MLSLKELVRRVAELLRKLLASKVLRNSLGGVLHLFQLLKRCLLGTRRKTIKGPGKDSGRTGSVRWLDKEAKSAVGRDPSCSIGQSGNSTAVEDATSCEKGYICASEVPASARLPAFHQHTPAFRASQHLRLDTAAPPRARSSPIVIDTPNGVDHDEYDIQVQSASTASLNSDPWQDRASYISIEPEEEHVTYRPTSRATTRADSRMVSRAQSRSRASRSTRDPSLPRSREPSPRRPMSGDFTPQPSPTHAHFEHAPLPSPARSSRTLYRLDPDTLQLPVPMSRESSVASVRGSILKIKRTMQPCMGVERYNREVVIQKTEKSEDHVKLEAMCLSFSLENIPKHWQACTHPEGALYFYHPKKRIYTDAYLCDPDILLEIEAFAAHIKDMIRDRECSVPSGSDLVLELGKDDAGETTWAYYFAYHENRTLFWLTEHDVHVFMHQEVRAVRSKAHIKHELESQYWCVALCY